MNYVVAVVSFYEIVNCNNTGARQTPSIHPSIEYPLLRTEALSLVLPSCNCGLVSPMAYRIRGADTHQIKDSPDKLLFLRISTCDAGHFVGEVALLQILKMSRQPLPP